MKRNSQMSGYVVIQFKDTLTESFLWGRRCDELSRRIRETLQQLCTSPSDAHAFREHGIEIIGEWGEPVGTARWESEAPPSDRDTHVTFWVRMNFAAPAEERAVLGQTLQSVLRRHRGESFFGIVDRTGERVAAYEDALGRTWQAQKSALAHILPQNEDEELAQRLRTACAKARWQGEVTPIGVAFSSGSVNINGCAFELLRQSHHTDEDIQRAKRQLRDQRDVTGISVIRVPDIESHEAPADDPHP